MADLIQSSIRLGIVKSNEISKMTENIDVGFTKSANYLSGYT